MWGLMLIERVGGPLNMALEEVVYVFRIVESFADLPTTLFIALYIIFNFKFYNIKLKLH